MSACTCPHCKPRTASAIDAQRPTEHPPVELPTEPRPFRVHQPDGRTQDCTLHPDGRLTTVMNGETWRNALTFDEMRAMNWAQARIEWEPDAAPLEPELVPPSLVAEELPFPFGRAA